ncbi:MAG: ferrous iron transporter B [Phycisphaerales bacterium]
MKPAAAEVSPKPSGGAAPSSGHAGGRLARVALIGNPNTGKTTLFNRLCGLRHKTSNFPGTTLEARLGRVRTGESRGPGGSSQESCCQPSPTSQIESVSDEEHAAELIDLPGIYSLELDQLEAGICRSVLAGEAAPRGDRVEAPDAVCVVLDATNLGRNLMLAGEALRRRLPTVFAVNMIDLARRKGLSIDRDRLSERLGCEVALVSARTGEGLGELRDLLGRAKIPTRTPPGDEAGLRHWCDAVYAESGELMDPAHADAARDTFTDRLDRVVTHPVLGMASFLVIMGGLFYALFRLAQYPMGWIEAIFGGLTGAINRAMPPGILQDLLSNGVVAGVSGTVVFLPQICLLFFLISLLEDTGYLARAAFVADRVLRPFGLPGHSFVPLLSSHACALPGIMATRAIPDPRERLATILVAPFMTCSARLPVYVLVTTILFRDSPALAAAAFVGCYVLGALAGVLSALIARRTILRGRSRPMALELPTYKVPSLRTALMTTYDRAMMFLKKAGTNILMICIALWWLGAYPHVDPPVRAVELRQIARDMPDQSSVQIDDATWSRDDLEQEADRLEAAHAQAHSFIGRLGRAAEPVFRPLGYDWQLTIGVLASFAAREVFVSTMAVVLAGSADGEDQGVVRRMTTATRSDGATLVFSRPASWSLLVFFVLAMQCLPTLAVTARESGHFKWAVLQLAWMSTLAYGGAALAFFLAGGWSGGGG